MPVLLPCHSSYGNHLLADDLKQVPAIIAASVYNAATQDKNYPGSRCQRRDGKGGSRS